MDSVRIDGTENAPSIDFDPGSNVFRMGGMSYLEDVVEFFKPLMADLQSHFGSLNGTDVVFEFDMVYFNSSSARFILQGTSKNAFARSRWHCCCTPAS